MLYVVSDLDPWFLKRRNMFIVELEPNVWLAKGEGDPPRTLVFEHSKKFKTRQQAGIELIHAKSYRPFPDAEIRKMTTFLHGAK